MLYEDDASKPKLTLTLTEAVIMGHMKLIRDMLLPPGDAKDPSTTSLRAMSQLAVEGEKFLSMLQKAMLAAGAENSRVEFDGGSDEDEDQDEDDAELPPPPQFSLKARQPKALPPARPSSKKKGK